MNLESAASEKEQMLQARELWFEALEVENKDLKAKLDLAMKIIHPCGVDFITFGKEHKDAYKKLYKLMNPGMDYPEPHSYKKQVQRLAEVMVEANEVILSYEQGLCLGDDSCTVEPDEWAQNHDNLLYNYQQLKNKYYDDYATILNTGGELLPGGVDLMEGKTGEGRDPDKS